MNNDRNDTDGMGGRFWLGFVGVLIGAGIAALVLFMFFGWIWATGGFFAAFIVFTALALGFGYFFDRREREERRGYLAS